MSNNPDYKLSAILLGHSSDVRGLNTTSNNCIVSCSRDKTAKLWKNDSQQNCYLESISFEGHTGYVTCVLALSPSEKYPSGLVLTGGMDKKIYVFAIDNPLPISKLSSHTDAVCDLSKAVGPNSFVSSSWDKSAKLWDLNIDSNQSLVRTYSGHEMAVWSAIQLNNRTIVTASADKTLIIWSEDGARIRVLNEHVDCVRKVRELSNSSFVSVSNDASVKVWSAAGDCTETLYGHTNFIYDVCVRIEEDGCKLVTCGEDRTIRVWKNGQNLQVLFLPTQSAWSVKFLENGDIACGTSDGNVRVFTQDPAKIAEASVLKKYEDEVQAMNATQLGTIGGYKIADLPGPEALMEEGRTDGQTKIVRENSTVICYQWSASLMQWVKIGDVLGASGGSVQNSGKTLHDGKEYDYVFSIDVEEGKPPLKLPYNCNEDPWQVAQNFLHQYRLPQDYLEQVANFITKNAKSSGGAQLVSGYADPFTGGNRYVPEFGQLTKPTGPMIVYVPQKSFVTFDQVNLNGLRAKLTEFRVDDANVGSVFELIEGRIDKGNESLLLNLLTILPEPQLFPLLDILRLSVRFKEPNRVFAGDANGPVLFEKFEKFLQPAYAIANNTLLTIRILSNFLMHDEGRKFVFDHLDKVAEHLTPFSQSQQNKNVQIALSTFLLNAIIASLLHPDTNRDRNQKTIVELIGKCFNSLLNEPEAEFRCLVALGTISLELPAGDFRSNLIRSVQSLHTFDEKIHKILNDDNEQNATIKKRNDCAKQLISSL